MSNAPLSSLLTSRWGAYCNPRHYYDEAQTLVLAERYHRDSISGTPMYLFWSAQKHDFPKSAAAHCPKVKSPAAVW